MAYSDATKVQEYLPTGYQIGTRPAPSPAQVTQFLADSSNEIDAAIGSQGLSVPVTSPPWFVAECVRLNSMGAAAMCLLQIFPLQPSQPAGGYNTGAQGMGPTLYRRYDQRLSEIRKGIGIPTGAAVAEADKAPRSFFVDNNAIGSPDGSVTDAFGDLIWADSALSRSKVY